MNICVTGSKGFVGAAIAKRLEKMGHTVIPFDLPDNDILDTLTYPTEGIDIVVHAAAIADLNKSAEDLRKNYYVNTVGTYMMSEWAHKIGAKLLYVSTCCAWGRGAWPCVDDMTCPLPTEPYAHSKLAGEYSIKSSSLKDYMIFRIGTVYGPGMREALFNWLVIDRVINDGTVYLHDGGEQRRQYVYIDDLVDAFAAGVENWKNGKTYSICGSERISVLDSVMTVADILEKDPLTEVVNGRGDENFDQNVSIIKAERELGWTPKTSFYNGMKKTIKWYMENYLD